MPPVIPHVLHHPPEIRALVSSAINILAERGNEVLTPTPTLKPRSLASLFRRQATTTVTSTSSGPPIIPATYSGLNTGPAPGTIVGIVFGSVAGFLLLLWLIYTCFSIGGAPPVSSVVDEREETVIRRRSRSSPRREVSSHTRSEVIEVSQRDHTRSPSPPSPVRSPPRRQSSSRTERIVIEETTRRPSRPPPPPQDDIVEVIEEHSPAPPSRRGSRRQPSGYRTVDPNDFGGGDRPLRSVSRR